MIVNPFEIKFSSPTLYVLTFEYPLKTIYWRPSVSVHCVISWKPGLIPTQAGKGTLCSHFTATGTLFSLFHQFQVSGHTPNALSVSIFK